MHPARQRIIDDRVKVCDFPSQEFIITAQVVEKGVLIIIVIYLAFMVCVARVMWCDTSIQCMMMDH